MSDNATQNGSIDDEQNAVATDDDVDVRAEKDVLVTIYGDYDYEDKFDFMDDVFGEFMGEDSVYDTSTSEERTTKLVIDAEWEDDEAGETLSIKEDVEPFGFTGKQKLRRAIEAGVINVEMTPWLEYVDKTETKVKKEYLADEPLERFIDDILDTPDALQEQGYEIPEYTYYAAEWEKDVEKVGPDAVAGETETLSVSVTVNSSDIQRRRILTHQAERTPETRYETSESVDRSTLKCAMITLDYEDEEAEKMLDEMEPDEIREVLQEGFDNSEPGDGSYVYNDFASFFGDDDDWETVTTTPEDYEFDADDIVFYEEIPWSAQVAIHIEADGEDNMDDISEDLVETLYNELASIDGVEKVRLTDCEVVTKSQGECYNI